MVVKGRNRRKANSRLRLIRPTSPEKEKAAKVCVVERHGGFTGEDSNMNSTQLREIRARPHLQSGPVKPEGFAMWISYSDTGCLVELFLRYL